MLNKLSILAFVVGCICATILRSFIPTVAEFAAKADVSLPTDIVAWIGLPSLPLGTLIVGLVAGALSHAFKLHDKLATVLRLRHDFDVRWILLPMAALSGTEVTGDKLDKFSSQRHRLMKDVFYRYASSSDGRQVIDPHVITDALTNWSWFWFCLESCAFFAFSAAVLICYGQWQPAVWLLVTCLTLVVLMRLLRADSSKAAIAEVEEILDDPARLAHVRASFDAL